MEMNVYLLWVNTLNGNEINTIYSSETKAWDHMEWLKKEHPDHDIWIERRTVY